MAATQSDIPYQYSQLKQQISRAKNEEEIRLAWIRALEACLDIFFDAERERKDLSYNNVIIEFKDRGKFKGKIESSACREALEKRLLPYILRAAKKENLDASDYIGIAIDGEHLVFAQVINNAIRPQHLLPVSLITFSMVVEACRKSYRRAVTAANLIEDFGHTSARGLALMQVLAEGLASVLESGENKKIQMLFEEWRTLYGQVADLSREQLKNINQTLRFSYEGACHDDVSARLFVIHTFNSLFIKLLAAEIIAAHGLASGTGFSQDLAAISDDKIFFDRLRIDIEQSGFFEANGINGFIEEAIFSWYLDVANMEAHLIRLATAIREIVAKLSLYRMDKLDHTGDVLRDFYQNLVPDSLRKSLGEFYTPDWLVKVTVDKAGIDNWLTTRVLDPTCGSGSFLVEILRRKREAAVKLDMPPESIVSMLSTTVWGFDLNPLAVQIARTNFLMAIADLLKEIPGQQIEIPILMADAVYSPARPPHSDENVVEYKIGSQLANLTVLLPAELVSDRIKLDHVFKVMAEFVEKNAEYADCVKLLIKRKIITLGLAKQWDKPLKFTYEQVLNLHRQQWNGIWFRIVRNFFWSATAGKFDLIVGNPPWVRWSKLPNTYRERAKPTCEQYTIFSDTPHHGGNELDISGMITYTTADKWLKSGGFLVFVLTQTHFQTPSSQGFRFFRIDADHWLVPLSVDDMKALKPFPDAVNKTTISVFQKSVFLPQYPVPYRIWNAAKGTARAIPSGLSSQAVFDRVHIDDYEATPVGAIGSPWAILRPGRFAAVDKIRGRSEWVQGRKGITTDLNGIYFVNITEMNKTTGLVKISTRPEAGKTDIGKTRAFWIEPSLLYPLLKGASDFEPCYLNPEHQLFVIVPNDGITRGLYHAAEERIDVNYPYLKQYFKNYERQLRARSTWSKRMINAPYYAVYNIGTYTFSKFKVVWAEQSENFCAAVAIDADVPVLGKRPYIPDHKIFFIDFDKPDPAYFLCGILNSSLAKEFVESHNISIQVGDIFKHMNLPAFNPHDKAHKKLVELTLDAHQEKNKIARTAIVTEIKNVADSILEAL